MTTKFSNKYFITYSITWGVVGFARGMEQTSSDYFSPFSYRVSLDNKKKNLLIDRILYSTFKAGMFANPIFQPMIMYNQIKKLEINYRGLNPEDYESNDPLFD